MRHLRRILHFLLGFLVAGPLFAQIPNEIGDFDGDGRSDLLWRNYSAGLSAVWYMNGGAVTGSAFIEPGVGPQWRLEAKGDFDGDGKSDLVFVRYDTNPTEVVIWFMDNNRPRSMEWACCYQFWDLRYGAAGQLKLVGAADFDRDGHTDLLWHSDQTGLTSITYWRQTHAFATGPEFSEYRELFAFVTDWQIVGAADFNGDSFPDLLWRNYGTGQNAIWLMDGSARVIAGIFINDLDPIWQLEAIGDFDGDGSNDLAWRAYTDGTGLTPQQCACTRNAIWYLNGTTLSWTEFFASPAWQWDIEGK